MSSLDRRRSARTQTRLRVTSRELPGHTAVTHDLSLSGMRLETQGPLENDECLFMLLEAGPGEPEVSLWGRVWWCRALERYHLVGIRFDRLDETARRRLEALCQNEE